MTVVDLVDSESFFWQSAECLVDDFLWVSSF